MICRSSDFKAIQWGEKSRSGSNELTHSILKLFPWLQSLKMIAQNQWLPQWSNIFYSCFFLSWNPKLKKQAWKLNTDHSGFFFIYTHYLMQNSWFWSTRCKPPSKLKVFTIPCPVVSKKYWVQPEGAKLRKSHEYCVTLMLHWRVVAVAADPRTNVRSLHTSEASTYTENEKNSKSVVVHTWQKWLPFYHHKYKKCVQGSKKEFLCIILFEFFFKFFLMKKCENIKTIYAI